MFNANNEIIKRPIENMYEYKNTNSITGLMSTVRKIVCLGNGYILTCGLNNPGFPYSRVYMWETSRNTGEHTIYSPHKVYHSKIRDIYSLALYEEGTFLCGGTGGRIERWDINTCKLVDTYRYGTSPVFNLKVLRDGRFVTSSLSQISVWDMDGTHQGLLEGQRGIIHCLDELPNGDIITAGQSKKLCIWDAGSLACKKIIYTDTMYVYSMLLLDNNYVLLGHSNGLTTWDIEQELMDPVHYYMRNTDIVCMTKVTDSVIAYGDNGGMLVFFDLNTGTKLNKQRISRKPITSISCLYDERIVTGTFRSEDYIRNFNMPHMADYDCQVKIFENKTQPYHYSLYRLNMTMSQLQVFKEELISVTWAPERHLDWCVDIETRKNVAHNFNT